MSHNRAIEFHDSVVHAVRVVGSDTVVEMTVYVHASDGRPGVDAGAGWYQPAEMLLVGVSVDEHPQTAPLEVDEGAVTVEADRFENLVPMPFDRVGLVTVELRGRGNGFRAKASGLRIVLTGKPGMVEQFPGSTM